MHGGKPSETLGPLFTFWLFFMVPVMSSIWCLAPLKPKLSLRSYWQKAILEVSVWGEICQLFSTMLHNSRKKRESNIACQLWELGCTRRHGHALWWIKCILLTLKALWETAQHSQRISGHAGGFIQLVFALDKVVLLFWNRCRNSACRHVFVL